MLPLSTGEDVFEPAESTIYLSEDFTSWMPTNWTEVVHSGTGYWEQSNLTTSGRTPYDGVAPWAIADSDSHSGLVFNVSLFTPKIDLSSVTEPVYLDCGISFQYYNDDAYIRVWSTNRTVLEETLEHYTATAREHVVDELDFSNYSNTTDVQIEFYYTTNGIVYLWYFSVDNVMVLSQNQPPDQPTDEFPVNGSTEVELSPTCSVNISDEGGDLMNVSWYAMEYMEDTINFTLLDTKDDGGPYAGVWGDGNYIYAACFEDGIRAYSFNGSNFTLLDTKDDGGHYAGVWDDGEYIYTACYEDGIRAYSFNGSNFTLLDTQDDSEDYYSGVWGDGEYIYTVCEYYIHAYSFNGSNFTLLDSQYNSSYGYQSVWGDGEYVYAGCHSGGIRAYSFNGSNFTLLNTQSDGNRYYGVWGDGNYIYAACFEDGIRAYSFNGSNFTLLDTKDDSDSFYRDVWGDGTYIYAACSEDGIRAYIFNGNNFTLLDAQDDGGYYLGVWDDGEYIYTACYEDGIRAYSTSVSSYVLKQKNTSISNGTYYWDYDTATEHNTTYYWKVVVVDDENSSASAIFHFTTLEGPQYPDWDINQDGIVNYLDISSLISHYGESGAPGWIPEDINDDGTINYLDISSLISHYGESY